MKGQCPIAARAIENPGAPAVVVRGQEISYADVDAAVECMGVRIPVAPHERVGILGAPSLNTLCLLYSVWRQGAIAFPLSLRLPLEAQEQVIVAYALTRVITVDDLKEYELSECRPKERSFEGPAVVVMTSGSTSLPKAVVHPVDSLLANARGANRNMPLAPGDRWLLSLPLDHVSGLGVMMRTALAGAAVVLPGAGGLSDVMASESVTHVSVVATQLRKLVADWERSGVPSALKAVLAGGSHIPGDLVERACTLGVPLHLTYGCTEMGSQVTTTPPGATRDDLLTSGRVLADREVRIDGNGEILVRGACLCAGYLEEDGVRSCTDSEGWYRTGDTGHVDSAGRLVVTGRSDRMFISGGENIHPEEIEALLQRCDGVEEAVVVAVESLDYGERPVAFVRMRPGHPLDAQQIHEILAGQVPRFKIPDAILAWPEDAPADRLKMDLAFLQQRARALTTAS